MIADCIISFDENVKTTSYKITITCTIYARSNAFALILCILVSHTGNIAHCWRRVDKNHLGNIGINKKSSQQKPLKKCENICFNHHSLLYFLRFG